MKLSYYGYSIKHRGSDTQHLFDIRPFLNAFCRLPSVGFKSRFTHRGEQVFLLRQSQNLYLFLMTRTNEIIKKINSTNLTVSEIYDVLQQDERLGFASYVFIKDSYLGFASTVMAPKFGSFGEFVDDVFNAVGLGGYEFVLHPLLQQSTRGEAMSMGIMGRTRVQVNKENSVFDDIRNSFGATPEDFVDVDSMEIIIKPRSRANISSAIAKVITNLPNEGVDRFVVRAKEEAGDQLLDVYLEGKGRVSDTIKRENEQSLHAQIRDKIERNELLAEKVDEHKDSLAFLMEEPEEFVALHDEGAWQGYTD